MTIAYSSISSSVQAGSTSVMYRAPAALSAGDLILWCVVNKYPTNGPNISYVANKAVICVSELWAR